jgi:UDP-N-acetylmuramyl pentapeptide phosphotransferase/UDP-N-acetylglucosamine-1-phosphate transferase
LVINSFNLIDGVDGLASTLGMICSLTLGLLYLKNNDYNGALISLSLSSSLFAFLYYNSSPAKIFLGDTGSLIIGFVCSVLAINLINTQVISSLSLNKTNIAIIVFASMFIPIFDTFRVFFKRILSKKSPFHPDLNHLHHLLLNKGLSHFQVSSLLGGASIFLVTLATAIRFLNINIVVLILITLCLIFSYLLRVKK